MFYNNLKAICDKKGLKVTPTVLSCGGSKGSLTAWKNGASPNSDIVINLSVLLNVPTDLLLLGEERNIPLTDDEQKLIEHYNRLPPEEKIKLVARAEAIADVYDEQNVSPKVTPKIIMKTINIAEVAAGAGVSTPFTIDNAFSPKKFPSTAVPKGVDCGVPINGDSMEPDYPNGSIVWVKITQNINYGDVVIAILNGEPYCKIYQPDGLHSYNEDYDIIHIYEQDDFSIFGKVIGCYEE